MSWPSDLVHLGEPVIDIILRTALIYTIVLLGLRMTGKREVGQLTPFDLVLILLLANAVQNAMIGHDTSVVGGLLAVATLLLMNFAVAKLAHRNETVERILIGRPRLLIDDGEIIEDNLRREAVTLEALYAALREHGIDQPEEVQVAVLEIDGTISVVPKHDTGSHPDVEQTTRRPERRVRQVRHGQ